MEQKTRVTTETKYRKKAEDFNNFTQLFRDAHAEIQSGEIELKPFAGAPTIKVGELFVLNGLLAYVADVGELKLVGSASPRMKERLRLIFENGTESEMYLRSFASALGEDPSSRHLVRRKIDMSALASAVSSTGTIYVLKSLSQDQAVKGISNLYKIGYCTTSVEKRIANAEKSPTYLMAPVEIVAKYNVFDINIKALEHLIHQVFASVRLDLQQVNLKGEQVAVTEWFVVPLQVINQAMDLVIDGEIFNYYYYDKSVQALIKHA